MIIILIVLIDLYICTAYSEYPLIVYTEFQLIADDDNLLDLDISRIIDNWLETLRKPTLTYVITWKIVTCDI